MSYIANPGHMLQPYSNTSYVKPSAYAETVSMYSNDDYKPVAPSPYSDYELQKLEEDDAKLKYRIRVLRIVSRVLAVILSAATVAALAMTLVKYFETRNVYYSIDGEQRTAWADGTITIYTYIYFGVSTVSLLLETVVLIAYCRGIKRANKASAIASVWTGLIIAVHIVAWTATVIVYRYGREPVDGKFKDLWGWTCSTAADEIQPAISDINFQKYCTVQVRDGIRRCEP